MKERIDKVIRFKVLYVIFELILIVFQEVLLDRMLSLFRLLFWRRRSHRLNQGALSLLLKSITDHGSFNPEHLFFIRCRFFTGFQRFLIVLILLKLFLKKNTLDLAFILVKVCYRIICVDVIQKCFSLFFLTLKQK